MPSHVALLRGINVGGHSRVAMADLREVAASLGWTDVATYVQSGNLVFAADAPSAGALERAIADRLGVRCAVVVLARDELARVVEENPFPDAESPKHVHAVFGGDPAAAGDVPEAQVVGRTIYLHTPDGFGRNRRATRVAGTGTARNWSTVTKLLALLDA